MIDWAVAFAPARTWAGSGAVLVPSAEVRCSASHPASALGIEAGKVDGGKAGELVAADGQEVQPRRGGAAGAGGLGTSATAGLTGGT